jgi:hypothetical protein
MVCRGVRKVCEEGDELLSNNVRKTLQAATF